MRFLVANLSRAKVFDPSRVADYYVEITEQGQRSTSSIALVALIGLVLFVGSAQAQTPSPTPPQQPTDIGNQIDQTRPTSLQDAIDRASKQVSAYTNANLSSRVAEEDVRQARAAFLPKINAPLSFIYTTPSLSRAVEFVHVPSYISADAVTVFQALVAAEGEIDTSGKLRATLQKNIALLESARAGSEVAKRDFEQSVIEAYYALALATAKRRGASSNLGAALEFEENQRLQLEAGEVAPVDLIRARLQTTARRDELAQAKSDEIVAADALRILTGTQLTESISTVDLLTQLPEPDEIQRFSEATISTRPELAQFQAETRAAEAERRAAKAELLPQLTYSVSAGFISDSLAPNHLKNHTGAQATVGVTIPIFDWGATKSRIAQATLRAEVAKNSRLIAERQFVQAFYSARAQALNAQERVALLRQSIVDAESNRTASIARYRAGEAAITEVIDAENTLVTQRVAFYQALFDYQTAKAKLARAAGH